MPIKQERVGSWSGGGWHLLHAGMACRHHLIACLEADSAQAFVQTLPRPGKHTSMTLSHGRLIAAYRVQRKSQTQHMCVHGECERTRKRLKSWPSVRKKRRLRRCTSSRAEALRRTSGPVSCRTAACNPCQARNAGHQHSRLSCMSQASVPLPSMRATGGMLRAPDATLVGLNP